MTDALLVAVGVAASLLAPHFFPASAIASAAVLLLVVRLPPAWAAAAAIGIRASRGLAGGKWAAFRLWGTSALMVVPAFAQRAVWARSASFLSTLVFPATSFVCVWALSFMPGPPPGAVPPAARGLLAGAVFPSHAAALGARFALEWLASIVVWRLAAGSEGSAATLRGFSLIGGTLVALYAFALAAVWRSTEGDGWARAATFVLAGFPWSYLGIATIDTGSLWLAWLANAALLYGAGACLERLVWPR